MRVTQYKTMLNSDKHCYLVKEKSMNYPIDGLFSAGAIVKMLNDVFSLNQQSEEYLYLLCFNNRGHLLGVFEVSHGTHNVTVAQPREIFQKALLCNASFIVVAHNHPGGFSFPSEEDKRMYDRLKKSGELVGVRVSDSIIVGDAYYSFTENKI